MNTIFSRKTFMISNIILLCLILTCGLLGIFDSSIYASENASYSAQGIGQDIVNIIIIIPVLLISFIAAKKGSTAAVFIYLGTILYFLYSFIIYTFGTHFNPLFILYCWTLALSLYLFISTLIVLPFTKIKSELSDNKSFTFPAVFLIFISLMFHFLWLSEIIPSIFSGTIPESILESGLINNPVHAADLAIVLPGISITAILLLKKNRFALLLSPVIIVFAILLSIAIGGMTVISIIKQSTDNFVTAYIFGGIFIVSTFVLIQYLRKFKGINVQ